MSFLATELEKSLVNDKITASCQTSMSPKVLYQNVTNTKRELWKTDRLTSFQNPSNTIRLRCFDRVFHRPYRYFSIALKVVFSSSDRYKIFTSNWLWIEICENEIDITLTSINKKL